MKKRLLFLMLASSIHCPVFCQLTITNGTSVTTTGNLQIVIADMDINNTGIFDATGSTFHFTGTGNNSISGDFTTFDNITINKPAGKQLGLNTTLYVNGMINFISGNIELNDKYIHLGSTGLLVGESETSRVTSNNYGVVTAQGILNSPNAANPGNLGAIITSTANLGFTTITRGFDSQDLPTGGGKSILRTFEFNASNNTALNATLTMKYFDAELNGIDENSLIPFQRDGNFIYAGMSPATLDAAANLVTKTGYNTLSKYTLGRLMVSLPVTLTSFAAECKSNYIQLGWKTATEINSDRFDIQRSSNGTAWQKIGSVKSKGNSNSMVAYQYADNTLNTASAFYRLAQYDLDGKVTYSSVVKAGCGQSTEFKVMPNPVMNIAKLVIGAGNNSSGNLVLYNAAGQLVLQQAISLTTGTNQFQINMSSLAQGIYNLVFVQNGAASQHIKISKQ